MHFHRDVLAIADTFSAHVLRPEPDDVFTGSPPIGFTFGLGGLVVFPLRVGRERAAAGAGDARTCSPTPSRGTGSRSCSPRRPPTRRSSPPAPPTSWPASAAPCPPARRCRQSVWQAVHDAIGLRIIDGIGATEMLHIFISAADDDIRPGSTGRAVPGYTAAVLDDDGQPGARRDAGAPRRPRAHRVPLPRRRPAGGLRPATAGTSPATPTSATPTATSTTRRAPTT